MKAFLEKSIAVFFILGFIFIPLTFFKTDLQRRCASIVFSNPIAFIQEQFFPKVQATIDFSSDTIGMNLLLILLFLLAILVVFTGRFLSIKTFNLLYFSRTLACYYIAFILLKYGFDKVFKSQFYLPEPNILYTPFGNLSKDILFWSTMGTSHFYSVSMGIIEIATASLLLFRSTRILGLLLAIGVFINIILINFGFDISVKSFSLFLLFAALFAVFPYLKKLFIFIILQKQEQISVKEESFVTNQFLKVWLKTMLIGAVLLQILFPYFQSNNFNDDNVSRNFLHGAYLVTEIRNKNKILDPPQFPIKKLFIHRNNYLIFQNQNDEMTDFHYEINPSQTQLIVERYNKKKIVVPFKFVKKDSILTIEFNNYEIVAKGINWRKLSAIQDKIHFTVDVLQ